MKIIFDFDHTLFSARKLYQTFEDGFKKIGVSRKLFKETSKESKGRGRDYKPEKQFKLIHRAKPEIKIEKLKKSFEKILRTAPKFFYNDVFGFLKKWSKEVDFILLSYGEGKFQRKKIEASKVKRYFRKIFITRDIEKSKAFRKVFAHSLQWQVPEKTIFVEDNPQALSKTKASFPQIITVRINRSEGRYSQKLNNSQIDFSIKNLKELEKILKSL